MFQALTGILPVINPESPKLTFNRNNNDLVSIIVVHHNKPDYLNICLQSISVLSHLNNYEIIVVDNGSEQESQDYLDIVEKEGIKVVRKSNIYWSKSCNEGVKLADKDSKYFIFMHCDTVVLDPNWIDMLINISNTKDSGLVGLKLGELTIPPNQKMQFVQEWCVLITRECWNDIKPFPEELPMIGHAFIMTLRAEHKGYNPQSLKNPIVHHYQLFNMDYDEYQKMSDNALSSILKLMQM